MKKHKTIQFIVAALFIASACTDDRDNLMVNDQIGLLHSTYTETEIFRGMDTPYQLFVIKSGKGKQETEVSISVDETVLQSYNTDNGTSIQLLPSDCYTIPTIGKLLILNGMPTVYPIFFLRERNMACPYK